MGTWKKIITVADNSSYLNSNVSSTDIDSNISSTEYGYLNGVTSSIQTQLDAKAPSSTVSCTTTNVTNAGALMDSEITSLSSVKGVNQDLHDGASPTFQSLTVDDTLDTDICNVADLLTCDALTVSSNADTDIILGTAKLSSTVTSDQPMLSHFDHQSATNYSWSQTSSGKTIINSASGQDIEFRVNNTLEYLMDGGDFHADGDIIGYSSSTASDKRLKKDIVPFKHGIEKVLAMNPVNYHWKDESRNDNQYRDIGFIAQEMQEILPNVVKEVDSIGSTLRNDGIPTHLTISYNKIIPVLVNAFQEMMALQDKWNERIETLEKRPVCQCKAEEEE